MGHQSARSSMKATGTTKEDFKDCSALPKICDLFDDSMANFCDCYVENSARAFEKEIKTCSAVKQWLLEPDFCDVILGQFVKGVAHEANPQFKTDGFSKLLVKGDNCCRYRIELDEIK